MNAGYHNRTKRQRQCERKGERKGKGKKEWCRPNHIGIVSINSRISEEERKRKSMRLLQLEQLPRWRPASGRAVLDPDEGRWDRVASVVRPNLAQCWLPLGTPQST